MIKLNYLNHMKKKSQLTYFPIDTTNKIVDDNSGIIVEKPFIDETPVIVETLNTNTTENIDIIPVVHGVIAKLLDYCKNKYIAIPKNLSDDDKRIVNNLEGNGYIKKILDDQINQSKLEEKDKTYDYYEIILDDKMKEIIQQFYDELQKLTVLNNIIVYEQEHETASPETKSSGVSPAPVTKTNINNLLNVFKDVNNMSSGDFFNSLGSVSKHMITGSKTQKNKAMGIPVNIGPKCKNQNLTKKSYFGIGNMFGAGKKTRTRKNNSNTKKTKKNRNHYQRKPQK